MGTIILKAVRNPHDAQMSLLVHIQIPVVLPLPLEVTCEDYPMLPMVLQF